MLRYISRSHSRYNFVRNLSSLEHVSPSTADHLCKYGYAVQDHILPSHNLRSFQKEARQLIRDGLATANKTHIISQGTTRTYEKSTVLQAELHTLPESSLSRIPNLASLQGDSSLCAMLSVLWPRLSLRDQSVKIQRSSGKGSCFPIHIDSTPSHDSRIITALIYPHESWSSHEGALRVYTTPISFVDLQPMPGRLVLLASALMHHRVMPANEDRYAITVWLSGKIRPPLIQPPLDLSLSARVAYHLLSPAFRDMSFRITLENEWITSLRESHNGSLAEELVKDFRRNLATIRRVLPGILCKAREVESSSYRDICTILSTSEKLKAAYHELEDSHGRIPFIW